MTWEVIVAVRKRLAWMVKLGWYVLTLAKRAEALHDDVVKLRTEVRSLTEAQAKLALVQERMQGRLDEIDKRIDHQVRAAVLTSMNEEVAIIVRRHIERANGGKS